ncbi:MAG: lysostaphin resistance A-like protein [Flavobacteriales bacterium]
MNNHLEEFEQEEKLFKLTYLKAVCYIGIFILGIIPAVIIRKGVLFSHLEKDTEKIILIIVNIIPFIITILTAYWWSKSNKEPFRFNLTLSWKLIPVIFFLMINVMMLSSYTTTFIPHDSGRLKELYDVFETAFKELMNPKWALIVSTCVFAPIFEEVLFRGILLKGLINASKNETQVWAAIFATSFVFGLIHGNPWQFAAAIIAGVALGYVYYRTKSLGNVIFMHALNNGISVYILLEYEEMEPVYLSEYPEAYNLLFLLGYIIFMYLIYFFTKNNTSRSIL